MSTVSGLFFAGAKALEVRVPKGSHDGASLIYDFSEAGLSEPEEMYMRYYVRFNDTWQRTGDGHIGKLPGFGGTYGIAGWGCRPSNGSNGWSARMLNFDRGATHQIGFYVYHADMPGTCGEGLVWPNQLGRNRWYCVEQRVKLNSITGSLGNRDGILEGWIDDQLVFSRKNLRFRDIGSLKIEQAWWNIYVGGDWVADRDMVIHFDNVAISGNRIGCGSAP